MKEIALLPDSLSRTPSVGMVSSWYARSFEEVLRYEQLEPTTLNMEQYVQLDLIEIVSEILSIVAFNCLRF